jgi:hypothetical protein
MVNITITTQGGFVVAVNNTINTETLNEQHKNDNPDAR